MRILFIGDVVGSPGRQMLTTYLPKLRSKYKPTVTIVNGENSASGKGITEKIYKQILDLGAQVVTLGNHTWDQRDLIEVIDHCPNLVRPANFPEEVPGQGYKIIKVNEIEIGVINIQGRTFLPPLDCPFKKVDQLIAEIKKRTPIIFVDFHAEATSEKQAMGWYLDGRVSAVVGTHTHVQTGDFRILPNKTAYITDVGMTGPYDGILGMEREAVLKKFITSLPVKFEVAKGREQLNGVIIDIDEKNGAAKSIKPIIINEDHPFFD
ncbi:metallophosphoesterase [Anaerobacillus arseniciselenatis]|uniref:Metallophosphoesterase n=1 Tax=Anaerobacillus arseniciselenatis TaxID=85682 RepID=A0A1S2LCC7_9BACI|nr:TIGR00282 family metallophosphoesterase [Anaerobacillus arseniciselenatis]OIJ09974.1 metallophosphoesterase [Anaerobacillus arseniciselenatis]